MACQAWRKQCKTLQGLSSTLKHTHQSHSRWWWKTEVRGPSSARLWGRRWWNNSVVFLLLSVIAVLAESPPSLLIATPKSAQSETETRTSKRVSQAEEVVWRPRPNSSTRTILVRCDRMATTTDSHTVIWIVASQLFLLTEAPGCLLSEGELAACYCRSVLVVNHTLSQWTLTSGITP